MLMWIFFWWLLGVLILAAITWRNIRLRDLDRIELGDVIGLVFAPLIWPVMVVFFALEDDWLSVPVFDLDWFRKEKNDD